MGTKAFSTLAVMGVSSGLLLEEGGFGKIHEVFDHFYPGIMTMGVAAMSSRAAAEVDRQVPNMVHPHPGEKWQTFAKRGLVVLGDTIELSGPIAVSDDEASQAFDEMGERVQAIRAGKP